MFERALQRRLPAGLLMLALLLVSAAGMRPALASETPARYDVEIIVFRNLSGQSDGEQWPLAGMASPDQADHLHPEAALADLPGPAYRMQAIADSLNRSGAYRVLAHRAWRQTARDRARATPFPVSAASDALEGTITLVRERFLHLAVNLVLQSTYVLDEKRRVRSGELHYFDHPMFGVIAQVNPYAAPAPDSPVDAPVSPAAVPDTGASGEAAVETPVPVPGHRARQAPY